jgi:hypothetical protein
MVGVGLGTERGIGLKTEMDAFNRSSMDRKADGILKSDSSSDIKIQGKEVRLNGFNTRIRINS